MKNPMWPRATALGAALALGIAGWMWFRSNDSANPANGRSGESPAGNFASSDSTFASANSAGKSRATASEGPQEVGEPSPAELAKIRRQFDERLVSLSQLRAEATRQREELSKLKPNPFEVAEYGRTKSAELAEHYQKYVAEHPQYFQGKDSPFQKLLKLNYDLKVPAYLLQLANSNDPVEGTTLGAVIRSVFDTTSYHEILVDQLTEALKGYPNLAVQVAALEEAKDAETALAILGEAEPLLSKEYQARANPISGGDKAFETYMDDTFRSLMRDGMLTVQQEAKMEKVNAIEQKSEAEAWKITALLEQLPRLSDARAQLATLFKEALK